MSRELLVGCEWAVGLEVSQNLRLLVWMMLWRAKEWAQS